MATAFAGSMPSLLELYFPPHVLLNDWMNRNFLDGNTSKLRKIKIPYTAKRLPANAFANTKYSATLIIGDPINGSNLLSIGDWGALAGITSLVLYARTPPYWHSGGSTTYEQRTNPDGNSFPNRTKLYVPDELVDTYKNSGSDMWGNFSSRIYPMRGLITPHSPHRTNNASFVF